MYQGKLELVRELVVLSKRIYKYSVMSLESKEGEEVPTELGLLFLQRTALLNELKRYYATYMAVGCSSNEKLINFIHLEELGTLREIKNRWSMIPDVALGVINPVVNLEHLHSKQLLVGELTKLEVLNELILEVTQEQYEGVV